jgi:UDP-glucose 4-epimerase
MALYLVTGGAGFIGSHLVATLLEKGHSVRVLDNLSTGKLDNLSDYINDIEFIEGDICDEATVRVAVRDVDSILHEAALVSVAISVREPLRTEEINVLATIKLLLAARDAGVRRFVYATSAAVYGSSPELPKRETMLPYPNSPYGFSKLAMEHYARLFTELYSLETVGLRYFNVLGPRQDPSSEYSGVIAKFATTMLRGASPTIYGDGLQTRDFIHVRNVVQANLLAASAPMAGGVFNVATGHSYSLLDLISELNDILGTNFEPKFAPARQGDIKYSQADISLIRKYGYEPEVDFKTGLSDTVQWYLKHAR